MIAAVFVGLVRAWQAHPVAVSVVGGVAVLVAVLLVRGVVGVGRRVARWRAARPARPDRQSEASGASGAWPFYVVAAMCTGVSVNTSWRFFGQRLHIADTVERVVLFAVVEAALVACAYGMRANVRRPDGQPGAPRTVAWALSLLSGYMAIAESDLWEGIARVALGPVLGITALHLALGVEIRRGSPGRSGAWAQLARELRERVLSRFGLANDDRDAATRTRHRAAVRAARLAATGTGGWVGRWRAVRLARAVRAAGVAHDPAIRQLMLDELAALKSLGALTALTPPAPWGAATPSRPGAGAPRGTSAGGSTGTAVRPGVQLAARSEVRPAGAGGQRSTAGPVVQSERGVQVEAGEQRGPVGQAGVQAAAAPAVQRGVQVPVRPARAAGGDAGGVNGEAGGAGASERARAVAQAHAAAYGALPTVTALQALAEVSRGTAHTAIKALREQPDQPHQLHIVPSDEPSTRTQA